LTLDARPSQAGKVIGTSWIAATQIKWLAPTPKACSKTPGEAAT
jgi:hypothetical protein